MLNLDVLENSPGLVSSPNFVYQKNGISCYILLTDHISLTVSLLLSILGNMCIVMICFPVDDVINFESNLSILIKLLSYITKNASTKA